MSIVFSILLIMVCAQFFSFHFHLADGDSEHQSHVHAHAAGSLNADHLTTEHDEEATTDIPLVIAKRTLSVDLFLVAILVIFSVSIPISKPPACFNVRCKHPRGNLLFFRPLLRAPPD